MSSRPPLTGLPQSCSATASPGLAHLPTGARWPRRTDPGRAPNYWKIYPVGDFSDTAIANQLLTILHDVYAYNGSPKLEFKTEKGG